MDSKIVLNLVLEKYAFKGG